MNKQTEKKLRLQIQIFQFIVTKQFTKDHYKV